MSGYNSKVRVVRLITVILAAVIGMLFGMWGALLTVLGGSLIIIERHMHRCPSCGSWRVFTTERWVPDNGSHYGTVYEDRRCSRCGFREPIGNYRAAMWEHKTYPGVG